MSEVPVLGQAVQAPMVTAPKAVPRVTASHVPPSPIRAATASANSDPNSNRTDHPQPSDRFCRATRRLGECTTSDSPSPRRGKGKGEGKTVVVTVPQPPRSPWLHATLFL